MRYWTILGAAMVVSPAFGSESIVRIEGVCFSPLPGMHFSKSEGIDFDVVSVFDNNKNIIAKVYIGTNPDVGKYEKYTLSEYRTSKSAPTVIDMGKDGILGVSNKFYQMHYHIFGGTDKNMQRVKQVVSFCK
jgi:hypothetical protein